ncbi:MAG: ABC transporter permease [Herpetosiphon sp.]
MTELSDAYRYWLEHQPEFWAALGTHLKLSGSSLGLALLISLPLGIWAAQRRRAAEPVMILANSLRVVPSLAVLFLVQPYLGLGYAPSLVALTMLACPPLIINTYAGLRNVDRSVLEAATGMGMTAAQVLGRVRIPLALPIIVAGLRIATVEVIASAALAAFIAGGGLGDFIQRGFSVGRPGIMLVGTLPIALLALLGDGLLTLLQRATIPVER